MGETPRVWRPSMSRYLSFAGTGMVVVAVVAVVEVVLLVFLRTAALAALPVATVIVASGSIAFGSQLVRISRTSLSVGESSLRWRGVFGEREMQRSMVRGVLAPIKQPVTAATRMLLLSDGSQRVRLVAGLWAESDLSSIAAALHLQTSLEPVGQREVETRAPGATSVFGRHPWRTSVGAAALILALVTVVSVVLVLADHPTRGPARVSQQTVASQGTELGQVEQALGASGWSTPKVNLWTCADDDEMPGWQRHVESIRSEPRGVPPRTLGRAQAVLRGDGYHLSDPDRHGDAITLDGERDRGTDSATVEILIDPQDIAIDLTGACET